MQKTESIGQQAAKNVGYVYVKYVWFTVYDTKIYSGSLDEMFNKLMIDSSKHLLRGADCLKYLEKIENERPTEFKNYVEQISRLMGEEKIGYTLISSGYDDAFSKLYELLDDGRKFVLWGNVMNTHKSEKDMSIWAHIIHDILFHFYLHYHKSNLSKVEKMLNSKIGVHKLILTGNGIVELPEIYSHEIDAICYSTNWFDVLELLN